MHRLLLALVWVTVASSAVVFKEPAPVDLLTICLIGLLPLVGLVRLKRSILLIFAAFLAIGASSFAASLDSQEQARAAGHIGITIYLYLSFVVFSGFIVRSPQDHVRLLLSGAVAAGLVAAVAGIAGYFDLFPGADAFTLFERASGTFKDPNVLGPFLILPLLYCLHVGISARAGRAVIGLALAGILSFGLLLTFSRGAWFAAALAVAMFGYLAFVTAPTRRARTRLAMMTVAGLIAGGAGLLVALDNEHVRELMEQRLALTHSYDEGPEGRFGGQRKAAGHVVDLPQGLGSMEFAPAYHPEEPHNVYLTMLLNAGWIGGLLWLVVSAVTVVLGLRHAFRRTATQPLFIVALAALTGHVAEGMIIDSDHWRHFYFLLALVWGMMAGDRRPAAGIATASLRTALSGRLSGLRLGRPRARPARITMPPPEPGAAVAPATVSLPVALPQSAAEPAVAARRSRRRRRRLSRRQRRIIGRIATPHAGSETIICLPGPIDPAYAAATAQGARAPATPREMPAPPVSVPPPQPAGNVVPLAATTPAVPVQGAPPRDEAGAAARSADIIVLAVDKAPRKTAAPRPVPVPKRPGEPVWTSRERSGYQPVTRRLRSLPDAVVRIARQRAQPLRLVKSAPPQPQPPRP